MNTEVFDAIIVGAGQAGPAIAARCSREGLKTAVIERHHFGGTCVNVGCVPTKTLVASARAIRLAQRGAEFGFDVADLRVDMARVMARKDAIVATSRAGVEAWMRGLKGTEVIVGDACFVGPATLDVGGRRLSAPRIFLNVGGRAVRPALPGIDTVTTLDNVSVMELGAVPEHLVIVGGSYIGLEFAQLMRRLGAAVTVVERSARLLPREDPDVSDGIRAILEAEGVRFELGAECLSLAPAGERIVVGAACGDGEASPAAMCCWPSAASPTPTAWGLIWPASAPTPAATSRSTINAAPAPKASGPWATATGAARSRTRHGTTTRSWWRTCSTATRAASATASRATRSSSTLRWAVSA
jgi:pyruvate/2-oxoglutarate dehydrogenase complex dihydrolipoamide dehydrogenase (E3) component